MSDTKLEGLDSTYTAYAGWTTALASVADGGSSEAGTVVDLGTPTAIWLSVKAVVVLDGAGSDLVEVYAKWSDDNTVPSDDTNIDLIDVIQANGTTTVEKMLRKKMVKGRYHTLYIVNNAGNGLDTGTDFEYAGVHLDNT